MGLRGQLGSPDQDEARPFEVEVSGFQSLQAAFDLGMKDSATTSALRWWNRRAEEKQNTPLLSVNEANEMFPDLEVPFDKPVKLGVAHTISEDQKERRGLQQILSAGPQGTLIKGAQFGAQMLAHATDPIELTAGGLASLGAGSLGAALVNSGRFTGRVHKFGKLLKHVPGEQTSFTRKVVEGVVGNVAIEPFIIAQQKDDQLDVNAINSLASVMGGAIGFAGLAHGLGKAVKYIKNKGEVAAELVGSQAASQLKQGQFVDIEPTMKALVRESDGGATLDLPVKDSNLLEYKYEPIAPLESFRSSWYSASQRQDGIFDRRFLKKFGVDRGEGVYFTDRGATAHGTAASSVDAVAGDVYKIEITPETASKLQATSDRVNAQPAMRESIKAGLIASGIDEKTVNKLLKRDPTIERLYDRIEELITTQKIGDDAIEALNDVFRTRLGKRGILFESGDIAGVPHGKHNTIMLFKHSVDEIVDAAELKGVEADGGGFRVSDRFTPDENVIPRPTAEDAKLLSDKVGDRTANRYYDAEATAKMDQTPIRPTPEKEVGELTRIEESRKFEVDEAEKAGVFETPSAKKDLENYKTVVKDHAVEEEMTKFVAACRAADHE